MDIKTLVKKFEEDFQKQKKEETEELYNAIVDVINNKGATIQNILTAVELVKFSVITEKLKQIHNELKFG